MKSVNFSTPFLNIWIVAAFALCMISWWPTMTVLLLYVSGNLLWAPGDPWMLILFFSTPAVPALFCFREGVNQALYPPLHLELKSEARKSGMVNKESRYGSASHAARSAGCF